MLYDWNVNNINRPHPVQPTKPLVESLRPGFKVFADQEYALNWILNEIRKYGKVTCSRCDSRRIRPTKHQTMEFWCADCRKYSSAKTNTALEGSKISIHNWVLAVYFEIAFPPIISSTNLGKMLGITQPTAWKVLRRIRETYNTVQCPKEFETGKCFRVDIQTGGSEKSLDAVVRNLNKRKESSVQMVSILITELQSLRVWTDAIKGGRFRLTRTAS